MTLDNLEINRDDITQFILDNKDDKEIVHNFYKDFFKLRGSFLTNLESGILIDDNKKDDIVFILLDLLESISSSIRKPRTGNMFNYIPSDYFTFNKMMRFIYQTYGNNYNFYDFGSGLPIKTLIANEYGYQSKGFEISKPLCDISEELGLSDLIENKNFFEANLESPKIIYYYSPISKKQDMSKFEHDIISKMEVGDILFRIVIEEVNSYIGFNIIDKTFSDKNLFLKDFGYMSNLTWLKLVNHIKTNHSWFTSVWVKEN